MCLKRAHDLSRSGSSDSDNPAFGRGGVIGVGVGRAPVLAGADVTGCEDGGLAIAGRGGGLVGVIGRDAAPLGCAVTGASVFSSSCKLKVIAGRVFPV